MKNLRLFALTLFLINSVCVFAQNERLNYYKDLESGKVSGLMKNLVPESIGPTVMSGRVTAISVNPENPAQFIVAYASGGLWMTEDMGISFRPLTDDAPMLITGDIAVNWKKGHIWLGSGENNSSRSSYAGMGLFFSDNLGKSWEFKGLANTHRIGRILIHPENPDIIWVAALGALYTETEDRGLYKSTDGGKTWKKTLFINKKTGIIDLIADPSDPNTLYAASWERFREASNFDGDGKASAIYKSTDGGETWSRITTEGSGFPAHEFVGRIGLAVSKAEPKTVYAVVDNQQRRSAEKKEDKKNESLTKDKLRGISTEDFLKLQPSLLEDFLKENGFPAEYSAETVTQKIKNKSLKPLDLVHYLEDANSELFDTPVIGAEVYKSTDGGKSWERTHDDFLDDVFYSYGYYFGQIRVSDLDPKKLYVLGVPLIMSEDGGQTWTSIGKAQVHGDHHALWVNPSQNGHLISGNDGGINISFNDGEQWSKANSIPVGQFYTVATDNAKPYRVYGGLQDNGVWRGPSGYKASSAWLASGKYPYEFLLGGDGMQVAVDPRDNETVYTGYQFGYYFRINKKTGVFKSVKPKHKLGERPLRFNWQTPIHLSVHHPDVLYLGSHKVHRSFSQGDKWEDISKDLTLGGEKGNVPFGTITSLHESPLKFGLLYAGTDDGKVQMTSDGGNEWKDISAGLPSGHWVSRVQASWHELGRVYASLNAYRKDNFEAFVYVSEDFGKTWKRLSKGLPPEPVNVILEDPHNPNLLYVGTDGSLLISVDKGENFFPVGGKGFPSVAVHDLTVQARERELLIATHGRSLYKLGVSMLEAAESDVLSKPLVVFKPRNVMHSDWWGKRSSRWSEYNKAELKVCYFTSATKDLTVEILTDQNIIVNKFKVSPVGEGFNTFSYDLRIAEEVLKEKGNKLDDLLLVNTKVNKLERSDDGFFYLPTGKYKLKISYGDYAEEAEWEVK